MKTIAIATLALAFFVQDQPGAVPAPKTGGWLKRHEGFVEEARKGGFEVLFQGDSITDGWRNGAAKKIWDATFAPMKAANFGISGDRTQHVLWRLQNGEFEGITLPKVVVLMIGTNNIGQKDPEPPASAVAGVDAILKTIHKKSEMTKVLLLGVFPRGEKPDHPHRAMVKEINSAIAKFDDGGKTVKFLDVGEKFLQPEGTLTKEVMPDFLHLSEKGYQIWADAIKEPLTALLK
ncbi:MAG TPA: GDSL-type esterase/lipase family protein [Planctomycetota bacterium]|nr:GDSL-type esterase/lipase family protein [Planctomycetota bacterium]